MSWHILFAPAATPKEIVERLHQEMRKIMSTPEMNKRVRHRPSPAQLATDRRDQDYMMSEQEKWGSLVKKLGLQGTQ